MGLHYYSGYGIWGGVGGGAVAVNILTLVCSSVTSRFWLRAS